MDEVCGNCRYWIGEECRRYPPVLVTEKTVMTGQFQSAKYPKVGANHPQCGEFEEA